MRVDRLAILLTVILVIWAASRTRPGILRHLINRLSAIGAIVSVGLWIGCFFIEASGYSLPIEGWMSGFVGWLFIFWLLYVRTKPPPAICSGESGEAND